MKQYPLEILGNRLRVRQRMPIEGAKFRTHEVGLPGHSQRIAMKNPATGRWVTQSWTFPVEDVFVARPNTVKILKTLGRWEEAKVYVGKFMRSQFKWRKQEDGSLIKIFPYR